MKKLSLVCLAALMALVTGCPHNDYTIELTPRGHVVGRRLDFYRADGVDDQGAPKYETFSTNELATIAALYPQGSTTHHGERHVVSGEFSGALPGDVGGAGEYRHCGTSLGNAGFYVERFRGTNNLRAMADARLAAADQLADHLLGWSRAEFGREPGYKNLRRFLDQDFRYDLENFGLHFWAGELAASGNTNAAEEFAVRLGQYLMERGYFKTEDLPGLGQFLAGADEASVLLRVQKLVAEKLGVPASGPRPKSLAVLDEATALAQSWNKFLAGTGRYRELLRQWERDKKTQVDLPKPEPSEVGRELIVTLIESGSGSEDDRLTVRLTLVAAPDHTNGKWDPVRRQVVWESNLEVRESVRRLPVFCYASWSQPDETFQVARFGRVILRGDELLEYGLWHAGLDAGQVGEWEKLLVDFRPGEAGKNRLAGFKFSTPARTDVAALGRKLLLVALERVAVP